MSLFNIIKSIGYKANNWYLQSLHNTDYQTLVPPVFTLKGMGVLFWHGGLTGKFFLKNHVERT